MKRITFLALVSLTSILTAQVQQDSINTDPKKQVNAAQRILTSNLNQKGLTIDNLKQYNNYRFSVTKTESFDAGNDNFPKLTCSNIVNEISKLKYNLKVTQLDLFLIELKKY